MVFLLPPQLLKRICTICICGTWRGTLLTHAIAAAVDLVQAMANAEAREGCRHGAWVTGLTASGRGAGCWGGKGGGLKLGWGAVKVWGGAARSEGWKDEVICRRMEDQHDHYCMGAFLMLLVLDTV